MFIESRAIDDRATAGSFRTAHQRYASDTDTWFDGTPQSIDGRIARARRLVHLAKESVARRGIQTDRLAAISSLEADIRALTALRHDLLTGAIDREDNSPIAGVRIAGEGHSGVSPETYEYIKHKAENGGFAKSVGGDSPEAVIDFLLRQQEGFKGTPHYERSHPDEMVKSWKAAEDYKNSPDYRDITESLADKYSRTARHDGDEDDDEDQDWANTWTDHNEQPNDYLFDEKGQYRRERFAPWKHPQGEWDLDSHYRGLPDKGRGKKEEAADYRDHNASLSTEDRRYVTLESSRFLAANTDTNDVRELATRAMHFAQKVTSGTTQAQSGAITTAFVQRVADGATQRRESAAHLRQGLAERPRQKTASLDSLPPEAMFL